MRSLIVMCAILVAVATTALSETAARCPNTDGDACEEWRVEQADKELAELIASPSEWIDRMPAQLRESARAALVEAQAQWTRFREAECRRELTWSYATARTKRGYLANCALNMTFHRRNELEKQYRFKSQ